MNINELITVIKTQPNTVNFDTVIKTIDEHYHYTPTRFTNGIDEKIIINEAGTNEGSCKIFSFASLNNLNKEQTLTCFGKYYRDDVLKHPDNTDHGNIRSFMIHDWKGINFNQQALLNK